MMSMSIGKLSAALLAALVASAAVRADDWPQWLGPQRDGVWRDAVIVEKLLGEAADDALEPA